MNPEHWEREDTFPAGMHTAWGFSRVVQDKSEWLFSPLGGSSFLLQKCSKAGGFEVKVDNSSIVFAKAQFLKKAVTLEMANIAKWNRKRPKIMLIQHKYNINTSLKTDLLFLLLCSSQCSEEYTDGYFVVFSFYNSVFNWSRQQWVQCKLQTLLSLCVFLINTRYRYLMYMLLQIQHVLNYHCPALIYN